MEKEPCHQFDLIGQAPNRRIGRALGFARRAVSLGDAVRKATVSAHGASMRAWRYLSPTLRRMQKRGGEADLISQVACVSQAVRSDAWEFSLPNYAPPWADGGRAGAWTSASTMTPASALASPAKAAPALYACRSAPPARGRGGSAGGSKKGSKPKLAGISEFPIGIITTPWP